MKRTKSQKKKKKKRKKTTQKKRKPRKKKKKKRKKKTKKQKKKKLEFSNCEKNAFGRKVPAIRRAWSRRCRNEVTIGRIVGCIWREKERVRTHL